MKRLLVYIILVLIFSVGASSVKGQACDIFEAEMKSYFEKYSPKSDNYAKVLESYWAKCANPTPAMNLIYYYARAKYHLNIFEDYTYRRSAYESARDNFYVAAADFQILRVKRYGEDEFWNLLNERYAEMENTLSESDPYKRYRDEKFSRKLEMGSSNSRFAKSNWVLNLSKGTSRAAANPTRKSFTKQFRYKDGYVDQFPKDGEGSKEKDGEERDEYGFVGNVDKLNLMGYLDWLAKNGSKGPELVYFDASSWISKLGDDYDVAINALDSLIVRNKPGAGGSMLEVIRYGEALAIEAGEKSVYRDDVTFIKVRTEKGVIGWVPEIATIPDGALAVITKTVIAGISPGSRLDRGKFILSPGDLIILSEENGDFIQIVTRDLKSIGWISANDGWSIVYDDVVIGMMYHEAMKVPYLVQRLKELETIGKYEGFYDSPLAELVLKEIEALK
ncbi:MAG: SH3 domain-containing protein [Bacteroidia bacterium]|nr:SH3 domain-containing protein [Bacteroidia bacterium]